MKNLTRLPVLPPVMVLGTGLAHSARDLRWEEVVPRIFQLL
jgi:hypothetical protein